MSVFVQLTGPKHCDFFVIPRRETAANPCIWVKCKSVFPPLSVYFTSASYINWPVLPPGTHQSSLLFHISTPNLKWFPKFSYILEYPVFSPPAHFLLFWSCSPPSCLSLLFSPPALKLWKGRQVASQSSRQTAVGTLDFVRAERDQLLVSGVFSSTSRIDHLKLNIEVEPGV